MFKVALMFESVVACVAGHRRRKGDSREARQASAEPFPCTFLPVPAHSYSFPFLAPAPATQAKSVDEILTCSN